MLSRIIFVAMLAMAVIIIPLGTATIVMAIELGLLLEALSGMLMLCVYIALSLYEVREFIAETEWEQQELNGAGGDAFPVQTNLRCEVKASFPGRTLKRSISV